MFWTDANAITVKQKHKWVLSFQNERNNFINAYTFYAKSIDRPSYKIGSTGTSHLYTYNFAMPQRVVWNPITITILDVVVRDSYVLTPANKDIPQTSKFFMNFLQEAGYTRPDDENNDNTDYLRKYNFKDSMIESFVGKQRILKFYQLKDNGEKLDSWNVYNPLITSVKFDKFDYSSEQILELKCTFVYEWAELESNIFKDEIVNEELSPCPEPEPSTLKPDEQTKSIQKNNNKTNITSINVKTVTESSDEGSKADESGLKKRSAEEESGAESKPTPEIRKDGKSPSEQKDSEEIVENVKKDVIESNKKEPDPSAPRDEQSSKLGKKDESGSDSSRSSSLDVDNKSKTTRKSLQEVEADLTIEQKAQLRRKIDRTRLANDAAGRPQETDEEKITQDFLKTVRTRKELEEQDAKNEAEEGLLELLQQTKESTTGQQDATQKSTERINEEKSTKTDSEKTEIKVGIQTEGKDLPTPEDFVDPSGITKYRKPTSFRTSEEEAEADKRAKESTTLPEPTPEEKARREAARNKRIERAQKELEKELEKDTKTRIQQKIQSSEETKNEINQNFAEIVKAEVSDETKFASSVLDLRKQQVAADLDRAKELLQMSVEQEINKDPDIGSRDAEEALEALEKANESVADAKVALSSLKKDLDRAIADLSRRKTPEAELLVTELKKQIKTTSSIISQTDLNIRTEISKKERTLSIQYELSEKQREKELAEIEAQIKREAAEIEAKLKRKAAEAAAEEAQRKREEKAAEAEERRREAAEAAAEEAAERRKAAEEEAQRKRDAAADAAAAVETRRQAAAMQKTGAPTYVSLESAVDQLIKNYRSSGSTLINRINLPFDGGVQLIFRDQSGRLVTQTVYRDR